MSEAMSERELEEIQRQIENLLNTPFRERLGFPKLLTEVRRSHTEAAELRETLRGYGRHTNKCRIYAIALREPTAKDCTCGFVTALSQVNAQANAQAKLENRQEEQENG